MASSWMTNPTDKDSVLLKHQLWPPFPVWGLQRCFYAHGASQLSRAAGEWPLYGVVGRQVNQPLPVVVAEDSHLFANLNLVDKWAAELTIKPKLYNLQPFATMAGDILRCIQVELIQPSHNGVTPTVNELSEIFRCKIGNLTYVHHTLIFRAYLHSWCVNFRLYF